MNWLRTIVHGLDELIFPQCCLSCELPYSADGQQESFCPSCRSALFGETVETCPRCSSAVGPHVDARVDCPHCRSETFHFETSFRLGAYEGTLRDAVLKMKERSGESLAEALGRVWGRVAKPRFLQSKSNLLVPIPLHWRRKWNRGYNQAAAIAQGVSESTGIPISTHIIKRTRQTSIQPLRSSQGRRDNVKDVFRVRSAKELRNLRILLIDDVLTTGATSNEAARVLKDAGVAQVSVAVVAHR